MLKVQLNNCTCVHAHSRREVIGANFGKGILFMFSIDQESAVEMNGTPISQHYIKFSFILSLLWHNWYYTFLLKMHYTVITTPIKKHKHKSILLKSNTLICNRHLLSKIVRANHWVLNYFWLLYIIFFVSYVKPYRM